MRWKSNRRSNIEEVEIEEPRITIEPPSNNPSSDEVTRYKTTSFTRITTNNTSPPDSSPGSPPTIFHPGSSKSNNSSQLNPRTHSVRGISRAKIKTVKLTVVVILGYIVCSTPFICVQLFAAWGEPSPAVGKEMDILVVR